MQYILDEQRKNNERIEELNGELLYMQKELKQCIRQQSVLDKKEEELHIDLYEQGKLEFIECDLNTWALHIENTGEIEDYYTYYYEGSVTCGYFKGCSQLEKNDKEHFDAFINDYFYYGHSNYVDRNSPYSESTECELAFDSGTAFTKKMVYNK